MAKIDFTLKVQELLNTLHFDDVPAVESQMVEQISARDLETQLVRSHIHARDVAQSLYELGIVAFPSLLKATDRANPYQLLALIRAMGKLGAEMPLQQNAAGKLVPFLDYTDMDVQLQTLIALDRIADPSVLKQIEHLASSDNKLVREQAVYVLATMCVDYPKHISYLHQSLRECNDRALCTLLANDKVQIPWEKIFTLLESPSDKVRERSLGQLARHDITNIPYKTLISLCKDSHPPAKAHAIGILARLPVIDEGETLEIMYEALQHKDKKIARPASTWLKSRSKQIQSRLPTLLNAKASLTRQLALDLLDSPLTAELIDTVGEQLHSRVTIQVRVAAVRVLSENPQIDRTRELLHEALIDRSDKVRNAALNALSQNPVDRDVDRLSINFGRLSGEYCMLEQTIALLGRINSPRALELLREQANHSEPRLQRSVQKILRAVEPDERGAQRAVRVNKKALVEFSEPCGIRNVLNDNAIDAATKVARLTAKPQSIQSMLEDFCNPYWSKLMQTLQEGGWEPKTDIEHAAVIVSQPDSDWSQFPDTAIPKLQPVFENSRSFYTAVAAAVECWPIACKPFVVARLCRGARENAQQKAERRHLEDLIVQHQLLSNEELTDWLENTGGQALCRSAVRIVGMQGNTDLADTLFCMLNNPLVKEDAPLYADTIVALANIGDRRIVKVAAELINNEATNSDWIHGHAVMQALEKIASDEALRLLQFMLRRPPVTLQKRAAVALKRLRWKAESPEDRARTLLHEGDAETLLSIGPDALPIICSAVHEAQESRIEWVNYLLQFDCAEAIEALANARYPYVDKCLRKELRQYFTRNSEIATSFLVSSLDAKLPQLKKLDANFFEPISECELLVDWLGTGRQPDAGPALLQVAEHHDLPVWLQRLAAEHLGKLGYTDAVPAIIKLLSKFDEPADKRVTIEALRRLKDPAGLEVLRQEKQYAKHPPLVRALDTAIAQLEKLSAASKTGKRK